MVNWIIADDGKIRFELDLMKHAAWYTENNSKRKLCNDFLEGEVQVSTVFLGIDHGFRPSGPPVLWETMIFGGEYNNMQWRYTCRREARENHARIVERLKAGLHPDGHTDVGTGD